MSLANLKRLLAFYESSGQDVRAEAMRSKIALKEPPVEPKKKSKKFK